MTEAKRRREADGRSSRVPIPVGGTIVAAARAAIRDPWRILAVSIVVSVVTVLLDIVADDLVDKTNPPVVFVTGLSATGAATFGDVFLSGFLCRIVSDAVHGTRASIRQVAPSCSGWRWRTPWPGPPACSGRPRRSCGRPGRHTASPPAAGTGRIRAPG
ncbi:MAG: hypothetical protein ABR922_09415 [Streptosporangiaceae bacterium]